MLLVKDLKIFDISSSTTFPIDSWTTQMNERNLTASQLLCDDGLAAALSSAICFVQRHWLLLSMLSIDPYC
jgi:hypothetical protein